MGLDIVTQRDCEIKEIIPQDQLLNQIKDRNRGEAVLEMIMKNGKSQKEALETSFTQVFQTPAGEQKITVKVSDLLKKTMHLKQLSEKCKTCVVSQNKEFGCIGFVSFPISVQCEKWLASLAQQANKKGLPYATTIVYIKDQKIDGHRIKQMRNQGQTFFEGGQPTEIVLKKSLFKKEKIDTDQLFDVTFLNGLMQATHINYLLMLFGGIVSTKSQPKDRYSKYNTTTQQYTYLDLHLPNEYDKSMIEFYNYFHHLFVALINGNDVLMN